MTRGRVIDWLVVLAVLAVTLADGFGKYHELGRDPNPLGLGIASLPAFALLARRTRPLQVLAFCAVLDVVSHVLDHRVFDLMAMATIFALYSCGRYLAPIRGWQAYGVVLTAEGLAAALVPASNVIAGVVFSALTVALGQYIRLRREITERRRAEVAERAVRAERQRIARELHDVVAHHISVMSVLVGGARTIMAKDPGRAAEALAATEDTARAALAEMRRLLAVLRAGDGDDNGTATTARAAQVPELVESVRGAGVRVTLEIEGEPCELPAAADLAVYRIVQEALTNARKHAPGARVTVRVGYAAERVEVEVADDGPGPAPRPADAPGGYGLGGMAERVALCGGRLDAGPGDSGGFRVHAVLPTVPY